MNRARVIWLWAALLLVMVSCKARKEITRNVDIIRKADEVYNAARSTNFNFDNLSLKATVSIKSKKQKVSFSSIIRMKRDSSIWVSASFFGIAGAKALLTPDSIILLNYRDKTYSAEAYSRVQDLLNSELLTLSALQDLLVGNMIELDEFDKLHLKLEEEKYLLATMSDRKIDRDWVEKKKVRMEKKKDRIDEKKTERLEKKMGRRPGKYQEQTIEYWIDPMNLKIEKIFIKDYAFKGEVETVYSDFRKLDDKFIPYHIQLSLLAEDDINVDIVYSKIAREQDVKMPLTIPEKYERIRL